MTISSRKLQVFVSSTFSDLREERQVAVEAILESHHIPAGMELFTAGGTQMTVIKQWIEQSDVYLLILGGRYGSIDSASGKSYTQLEYEYALSLGKPVFAVVLHDDFIEVKVKTYGRDMIETLNGQLHKSFKELVMSNLVSICSNLNEIKLAVIRKLLELDKDQTLVGWVRANQSVNAALLAEELASLSKENTELRRAQQLSNKSTITYNGLTFEELSSLLKGEEVPLNFDNLYEFIKDLGAEKLTYDQFVNRFNCYGSNRGILIQLLEKYSLQSIHASQTPRLNDVGLQFYLKAIVNDKMD